MEQVIASIYEISSTRGFGYFLAENYELPRSAFLKLLVSVIGAGPFSSGGGFTLLILAWAYTVTKKHIRAFRDMKVNIRLIKNLLFYNLICYGFLSVLLMLINPDENLWIILKDQWLLFSTNQFNIESTTNEISDLLKGITGITGRIGFLVTSYLTFGNLNN